MDSAVKQKTTELVRRVRAGDTEAYDELYRLTDRPLRAHIRKHYGHMGPDFVEEVASRTHVAGFAELATYDPDRSSFLTWLCWRSHNVARSVVRELYGERFRPFDATWFEEQVASGRGPAEEYERNRRDRVLREGISHLPEEGRRVVELHDLGGLTLDETAARLGKPRTTIWRARKRALAVLKRWVEEHEVQVVERDWTPVPRWVDWNDTGHDDWTCTVGAPLPVEPGAPGAEAERGEVTPV